MDIKGRSARGPLRGPGSEGKVDGPSGRGLWPPVGGRLCRRGRRPFGPRVVDCPSGNACKVSVTGLAFYVIWLDRHYDNWLAALASPYPAAPDFPLCRGQNKAPLCCELLMKGLLCRALLCPRLRGKGGGASHQRGKAFPRPQGGCMVLYKLAPSINLEAPSTTLSGIAAVKLKNPRGHSPVKL